MIKIKKIVIVLIALFSVGIYAQQLNIVQIKSVTYTGKAKIWTGEEATWQVATTPGNSFEILKVTGGTIDANGLITATPTAPSATSSTKWTGITVSCGTKSEPPLGGPVVYKLISVGFDKEKICQDETATLQTVIVPNKTTAPDLTFTGGPPTIYQNDQKNGVISEPGLEVKGLVKYKVTAGDVPKDASIYILDGNTGDWVEIKKGTLGSVPSDETFDWFTVSSTLKRKGKIHYMEAHGLTDPIETPYCGGEISVSRDELWNTGIEVGPSLYGVKVYKNHSTVKTVSMNKTWGEKNKKIKVKLMKHGIAAQARIYEEKRWDFEDEAWVHEVFSPLYVENQVDKTAVVWIDSYSWQEWQKCCDEVDL